jgi:hypothetical protein
MKTAEQFYEEMRKQGLTENITSNEFPNYHLSFYQDIFRLMEEYANQSRWISVYTELPNEGEDVLCISEEGLMSIEKRRYGKNDIYCDQADSGYAIHWQPLPNPPKP